MEAAIYVLEPLDREAIVNLEVGDVVFKVRREAEPGERLWTVFGETREQVKP